MASNSNQQRYIMMSYGAMLIAIMAMAAVFVGWMRFGTDILLTMAGSGLSWCL